MPKPPNAPPGARPPRGKTVPRTNLERAHRGIIEVQEVVERMRVTVEDARERLTRAHTELDEIRRKLPPRSGRADSGSAAQ